MEIPLTRLGVPYQVSIDKLVELHQPKKTIIIIIIITIINN